MLLGKSLIKECPKTVIADLNTWENKELTKEAVEEIIDASSLP